MMAADIKAIYPPSDSRQFLSSLKKILENVRVLGDTEAKEEALVCLVSLYFDCPAKVAAKRVLASFFQNLEGESQQFVDANICEQLLQRLDLESVHNGSVATIRHNVDNISALMENFKMGERCLTSISLQVIKFLVKANEHFLSQVHEDVPPVHLNEVMHHCHVTVQTLSLVLQKTVVNCTELTSEIVQNFDLMKAILDLDLQILKNELFLLDCRCCCSMNAVLLLQLYLSTVYSAHQISSILFPDCCEQGTVQDLVPWLTRSQIESLNLGTLSTLSYLAVVFGYISVVYPKSIITKDQRGSHIYVDHLLPNLLEHGTKCEDTVSKALYAKTVNLWTSKLLNTLQDIASPDSLTPKLKGESCAMQSLLTYVWTHWDDQLDVIRQSAKTVFENVLKIYSLVIRTSEKPDPFIQSILNHLFSVSWTCRGKFSAFASCVQLIGTQALLEKRPGLPSEVLMQLQEQALSCYASELYLALFTSHQQELSSSAEQTDTCRNVLLQEWMEPVVSAMCSGNKKLKQNIIEYLLPKLMKSDEQILNHMIGRLSSTSTDEVEPCYGAIIMCLRRARVLGLLRHTTIQKDDNFLWYGHLHPDVLRSALCSLDDQIRLDAFALLCENSKTAETITAFEFGMLKFFIPHNLNNQTPAFRQSLLSLIKKLFFRLKESLGALKRQAKKNKQSEASNTSLKEYEDFLTFLTNHMLCSLYPGSAFARRTTSLAILSLLTSFFKTEKDGFTVVGRLMPEHKRTLLECLTDTFEENKKEALNVLSVYITHQGPIWNKHGLAEIMKISMSLACSTRPQDCSTAVYNFLLVLRQQDLYSSQCDLSEVLPANILPASLNLKTKNPPLLLLRFLLSLLDDQIMVANQSLITAAANRPMYPTLHCIRYIMQELDFKSLAADNIPIARDFISSLISTCLNLATVVSPVVQNSSPEGNIPEGAILGPGLNISSIVPGDSVDISADKVDKETQPTPNIPESVILSRALVESMPEYLVVCCWRSIKEVSLTLGKMCLQLPVSHISETGEDMTLLSLEQTKVIGEYFTQQLLESIHRGAFELAYAGFQLMCQMLWNHPVTSFHRLPAQWLNDVMKDIRSDDPNSRLCSTRRSAGVPFYVQAISSTEPAATGRKCFHSVMKELLTLAVPQPHKDIGENSENSNAQVHALNILRALFRDARLGEDVVPYIAEGLKASILGFKSGQWAVRNSATLLLSALMTRMFGVKRSKDETAMSKKNCQTGRAFFHRYPSLYPFLLAELEEATADVGSRHKIHLHPSLYPVLLVLGRLFPSTMEGSDTNLSLSAFIPYVIRCACSPVYKTRVIASRALQPLARRNQVLSISQQLLDNLPQSDVDQRVTSSQMHGSLMQLCQLVKLIQGLPKSLHKEILDSLLSNLSKRTWLIKRANDCFATRQAAFELIDITLDLTKMADISSQEREKAGDDLRNAFLRALVPDKVCSGNLWQPAYYEFEKCRARLCLKYLTEIEDITSKCPNQQSVNDLNATHVFDSGCEDNDVNAKSVGSSFKSTSEADKSVHSKKSCQEILLSLLNSPLYEVRLGVLEMLCTALGIDNGQDCSDFSHPVLELDSGKDFNSGDAELFSDSVDMDNEHSHGGSHAGLSKFAVDELLSHLFDYILKMAVEIENHHECMEKVFYVLAAIPNCSKLLSQKDISYIYEIFSVLLAKLHKERRMEVKAAMVRFSGCLVPALYKTMGSVQSEGDTVWNYIKDLIDLLKVSSKEDDSPDLHISCCHVLLENAKILLYDPDGKLGNALFICWDSLANLLQEDDLEVKDIAASVLCVAQGLKPGAYHPSYALHCLPKVLVSAHAAKNLPGVVTCLLQWIMYDAAVDVKEPSERLFDKGEMNTYWDQVAFTRSVAAVLATLTGTDTKGGHSNLLNAAEVNTANVADKNHTKENQRLSTLMAECVNDDFVCEFWRETVSSLTSDLKLLSESCLKSDVYLNCARYMSLCQIVYRAKVLLFLFGQGMDANCNDDFKQCCSMLCELVLKVEVDMDLGNILTK